MSNLKLKRCSSFYSIRYQLEFICQYFLGVTLCITETEPFQYTGCYETIKPMNTTTRQRINYLCHLVLVINLSDFFCDHTVRDITLRTRQTPNGSDTINFIINNFEIGKLKFVQMDWIFLLKPEASKSWKCIKFRSVIRKTQIPKWSNPRNYPLCGT